MAGKSVSSLLDRRLLVMLRLLLLEESWANTPTPSLRSPSPLVTSLTMSSTKLTVSGCLNQKNRVSDVSQ